MTEWKKYRRTKITEMRPVSQKEIERTYMMRDVSISDTDLKNGSPKQGDMIARDPDNHEDQWLVSAEYFKGNFEQVVEVRK